MPKTPQQPDNQATLEWPTYWFAALERAVDAGAFAAAAEAQRQLDRLGVEVRFRPRSERAEGVARA